jgi:hypothetical protein
MPSYTNLLFHFGLNLLAIFIFVYVIYYRRHQNRENLTLFLAFNLFMFPFLNINFEISSQFAFTLFAILAVMRIRSAAFSKRELTYFFGAIAISVINAVGMENPSLLLLSNAFILLSAYIVDHPRLLPSHQTFKTQLILSHFEPALLANQEALTAEMAAQTQLPIKKVQVRKIDLARGEAVIDIEYVSLTPQAETNQRRIWPNNGRLTNPLRTIAPLPADSSPS